jgi:hypothetical protein
LADQKIPTIDKLHSYVCQTDKLLAKYVKIAEVDSGHILELDKSMENMRFMTNMNDQYMNESDNERICPSGGSIGQIWSSLRVGKTSLMTSSRSSAVPSGSQEGTYLDTKSPSFP